MRERFDAYLERCLYDPRDGFYASGRGSAGRRHGDFLTSPEVGPLFADVLGRAIDEWWERLGRPDVLPVYDAGTGPGTLVDGLRRASGPSTAAQRIEGVDLAPSVGRSQPASLPDQLRGAIVIANELLDNLPFRVVERRPDGWSEVWVRSEPGSGDARTDADDAGGSRPVEELVPLPPDEQPAVLDPLAATTPVGARVPIMERAARWVTDVLDRRPAALIVFDYGAPTTAELVDRGGWLRTYREHQRGDDPYREPGRWDVTTDVAIDQLPAPTEATDQASFLRAWGIDGLVEEGRRHWRANAASPDLAALRMRSRVVEAEALLDPSGLGSWMWCGWASFALT